MNDVPEGAYPFTTIDPSVGEADGRVDYTPGDDDFELVGDASEEPAAELERICDLLDEYGGTGVQSSLEAAPFDALDLIAVFPGSDDAATSEPHPHGSGRRTAPWHRLSVVAIDRWRSRARRPGRGRTRDDELW